MNEEIKYPVKYAVLEVRNKEAELNGYQNTTIGFIALQCYIIKKYEKFVEKGKKEKVYEILFPFKNVKKYEKIITDGENDINIDLFSLVSEKIDEISNVNQVFDSYSDAKEEKDKKNEKLRRSLMLEISPLPFGLTSPKVEEQFKKRREEIDKNFEICDMFERLVLSKTKDLEEFDCLKEENNKTLG